MTVAVAITFALAFIGLVTIVVLMVRLARWLLRGARKLVAGKKTTGRHTRDKLKPIIPLIE
jgi:hypothetical protein